MWDNFIKFFQLNGWKIIGNLIYIVISILLIKYSSKILKKIFAKKKIDTIISYFLSTLTTITLAIVLGIVFLDNLGVSTTPLIAVLSTAGLSISLALKDSLSNLASGITIIVSKPFKYGDYVEIGSIKGKVQKINLIKTEILTTDNKTVILPNNKVANSEIINHTFNNIRRIDYEFNIGYGSNIEYVKEVIKTVIVNNPNILDEPEPVIKLKSMADSSLIFITRVWVQTKKYWVTYYNMEEEVYKALTNSNIEIPFNKLDVNIKKNLRDA